MRITRFLVAALLIALVSAPTTSPALTIISGTGASTQAAVDNFRAAVGDPNNGVNPVPLPSGRREINWDGGGNPNGSPGATPFTVFQARGVIFTTPFFCYETATTEIYTLSLPGAICN